MAGRGEQCAQRRRHKVPGAGPAATAPGISASLVPAPTEKKNHAWQRPAAAPAAVVIGGKPLQLEEVFRGR